MPLGDIQAIVMGIPMPLMLAMSVLQPHHHQVLSKQAACEAEAAYIRGMKL